MAADPEPGWGSEPLHRDAMATAPPMSCSPDFRSVQIRGTLYTFTAAQALAVALLVAAFENGTPDVAEATILRTLHEKNLSRAGRLVDVFVLNRSGKRRPHAAWGTIIRAGATRGTRRLDPPNHHASHHSTAQDAPRRAA